ncbi:MAG: ArsR/SmtB family transcription factor [Streptomyces sp.]|uniref:ArsR/SmtB family transcription factor n=1 Tax=Streptomyces sp. TaxID=1931 RepID=UPI003D6A87A8
MRIRFTLTDVGRTRLADAPSPLAVTSFSTAQLAHRPGPPALDLWRRTVRAGWQPSTSPLLGALIPSAPCHPLPGFLRPAQGLRTLEDELERLLSTPRRVLRADLDHLAGYRRLPPWTRDLADGDREAADRLAESVRDYHRVAVAPYWPGLASALAADGARRTRQLRDGGVEAVLSTLHPRMHWRPPVLEVETGDDLEYDLGGRGLLLAPAAFSSYAPCDPAEEQPTLYYDITADATHHHPLLAQPGDPRRDLAALLGHSRAAVLEVIAEGVSTGQLAGRAGLSLASASEHATVLRRVGLVTTRRHGRTSRHSLTPLGAELLLQSMTSPALTGPAE